MKGNNPPHSLTSFTCSIFSCGSPGCKLKFSPGGRQYRPEEPTSRRPPTGICGMGRSQGPAPPLLPRLAWIAGRGAPRRRGGQGEGRPVDRHRPAGHGSLGLSASSHLRRLARRRGPGRRRGPHRPWRGPEEEGLGRVRPGSPPGRRCSTSGSGASRRLPGRPTRSPSPPVTPKGLWPGARPPPRRTSCPRLTGAARPPTAGARGSSGALRPATRRRTGRRSPPPRRRRSRTRTRGSTPHGCR
jgi:hypothetical protein